MFWIAICHSPWQTAQSNWKTAVLNIWRRLRFLPQSLSSSDPGSGSEAGKTRGGRGVMTLGIVFERRREEGNPYGMAQVGRRGPPFPPSPARCSWLENRLLVPSLNTRGGRKGLMGELGGVEEERLSPPASSCSPDASPKRSCVAGKPRSLATPQLKSRNCRRGASPPLKNKYESQHSTRSRKA